MIKDKGILIKNIFYMLSYAFQVLQQGEYKRIASETFENTEELLSEILSIGITNQIKRGLYREYISTTEDMLTLRCRLDIVRTTNNRLQRRQELCCTYDKLSVNNQYNGIIKTAIYVLIKSKTLKQAQKDKLQKTLRYFNNIDIVKPSAINWKSLTYQRNNRTYEMIMFICYFVLHDLMLTTDEGRYKIANFIDKYMPKLYEKFILEYYRKEHRELCVDASKIEWNFIEQSKKLPEMKTDITLRTKDGSKTLIIDAKYYEQILKSGAFGNKEVLRSHHLYQIFTYVINEDKNHTGNVHGLLLYAKTGKEEITPIHEKWSNGNIIAIRTLDLNTDWNVLKKQLDDIVVDFFLI